MDDVNLTFHLIPNTGIETVTLNTCEKAHNGNTISYRSCMMDHLLAGGLHLMESEV